MGTHINYENNQNHICDTINKTLLLYNGQVEVWQLTDAEKILKCFPILERSTNIQNNVNLLVLNFIHK